MGVPKFYRWISERYPLINRSIGNGNGTPSIDNLYLDMNGIIHNCSRGEDESKLSEEEMFLAIFRYIEMIMAIMEPKKLLFMAIDGVAPRAKMNQQRSRRFRSAKERKEAFQLLIENGEIPKDSEQRALVFDSNCITLGTKFMTDLSDALRFFILKKVSEDRAWATIEVILSGPDAPGEGEHKVMEYIRAQRASGSLITGTSHCLYGLDADLIMLALVTHEPNFVLLREKVDFSSWRKPGRKNIVASELQKVVYGEFELLSIGVLREYLEHEFREQKSLSFYDLERLIDDFVFFCFLVGNDFLPHSPSLDIREGALGVMMRLYKQLLPRFGGYLTDSGTIHWVRFEIFVSKLGLLEAKVFSMRRSASKSSKKGGGAFSLDTEGERLEHDLIWGFPLDYDDDLFDDGDIVEQNGTENEEHRLETTTKRVAPVYAELWNEEQIALELESASAASDSEQLAELKRQYYIEKLEFDPTTNREKLTNLCKCFMEGLMWTLHYYYTGVVSWRWFFPYHYAPMASDLIGLQGLEQHIKFDLGSPYLPFQQLLAVLPPESLWCLPRELQLLVTNPASPLAQFFPSDIRLDANGKRNEWEAVVLLPFVEESVLISTERGVDQQKLTEHERKRNTHGDSLRFKRTVLSGSKTSILVESPFPRFLPSIRNCRASMESVILPAPLPGRRLAFEASVLDGYVSPSASKYFTDHPSLYTSEHKSTHSYCQVNLFGMQSKGESIVIHIGNRKENPSVCFDTALSENDEEEEEEEKERKKLSGEEALATSENEESNPKHWNSAKDAVAFGIEPGVRVITGYPWVEQALVVSVSDITQEYCLQDLKENGKYSLTETDEAGIERFEDSVSSAVSKLFETRALDVISPKVMVTVAPMKSKNKRSRIAQTYDTSSSLVSVPIQLVRIPKPTDPESRVELNAVDAVLPGDPVVCVRPDFYGCLGEVIKVDEKEVKSEANAKKERKITVGFGLPSGASRELAFGRSVAAADKSGKYYTINNLAKEVKRTTGFISKLVGSIPVRMPPPRGDELDVGLCLRFVSRNLIVPGYSKVIKPQQQQEQQQEQRAMFLISEKGLELVKEYLDTFGFLADAIEKASSDGRDRTPVLDWRALSTDPRKALKLLMDVKGWLKLIEPASLPLVSASSDVLSRGAVLHLEKLSSLCKEQQKRAVKQVMESGPVEARRTEITVSSGKFLFGDECEQQSAKSEAQKSKLVLGDRVVNCSSTGPVPLGLRGTVVGRYSGDEESVEVVFDEAFPAGTSLHGRCSDCRGKVVAERTLLRVFPAEMQLEEKIGKVKYTEDSKNKANRKSYRDSIKEATKNAMIEERSTVIVKETALRNVAGPNRSPPLVRNPKTAPSEESPFMDINALPMPTFTSFEPHTTAPAMPVQLPIHLTSLDARYPEMPVSHAGAPVHWQSHGIHGSPALYQGIYPPDMQQQQLPYPLFQQIPHHHGMQPQMPTNAVLASDLENMSSNQEPMTNGSRGPLNESRIEVSSNAAAELMAMLSVEQPNVAVEESKVNGKPGVNEGAVKGRAVKQEKRDVKNEQLNGKSAVSGAGEKKPAKQRKTKVSSEVSRIPLEGKEKRGESIRDDRTAHMVSQFFSNFGADLGLVDASKSVNAVDSNKIEEQIEESQKKQDEEVERVVDGEKLVESVKVQKKNDRESRSGAASESVLGGGRGGGVSGKRGRGTNRGGRQSGERKKTGGGSAQDDGSSHPAKAGRGGRSTTASRGTYSRGTSRGKGTLWTPPDS